MKKPVIKINIVSLYKIWRAIRKWKKQQSRNLKIKSMCFKKIIDWFRPEPDPEPGLIGKRTLITFGRNKYGGGSDLNGCVNDSNNLANKLTGLFSDFVIRKFLDYDVTAKKYLEELENAVKQLSSDATILVLADSCFSETSTRLMNSPKHPTKVRFFDPGLPPRKKNKKMFSKSVINHILISGCEEHATSADAYINGKYQGAFTYFAIKTLKKGITYLQWFTEIKKGLADSGFEQVPTIEGPDRLVNRIVFEDETLVIHNSSHGSYTYDKNGDEEDGQDEGYYFDRLLIDDEVGAILSNFNINK